MDIFEHMQKERYKDAYSRCVENAINQDFTGMLCHECVHDYMNGKAE
jgi:hypothetical protein